VLYNDYRRSLFMKKYDRREALAKLAGIGAGVAGLGLCAGCPGGSTYGHEKEVIAAGGKLENVVVSRANLAEYNAQAVEIGGRDGFLYQGGRNENVWHAVDARCTHSGCKVAFNAETQEFVCPCHGSRFEPDGTRISGPARRPLKTYEVLVTENSVSIIPDRPETAG
jgi:Rieske Fe-S protein